MLAAAAAAQETLDVSFCYGLGSQLPPCLMALTKLKHLMVDEFGDGLESAAAWPPNKQLLAAEGEVGKGVLRSRAAAVCRQAGMACMADSEDEQRS